MLKFLPVGFIGLMVGGLIAANSSTILTHLNWGASYLVHDFYRRFIKTRRDREALRDGGAAAPRSSCSSCSSALVFVLDSAKDAFDVILQIGAGTGLLYLVRWFWWRVNAWCEVVAMVSSFVDLARLPRPGEERHPLQHPRGAAPDHRRHDGRAGWRRPTSARRPTARRSIDFYTKVRPFGPGWKQVRKEAGLVDGWGGPRRRGRQHPAGAARLGGRLHDDLVGALHGGQLPLRPHAAPR